MWHANPPTFRLTLRVLARLLQYPDATRRASLGALADALQGEAALPVARQAELLTLMRQLQAQPGLRTESDYVDLFDRGRSTSLHLFEHVHGDSRDRGPAMIDLVRTYEAAGLYLGPDELPDYLPVLLEFASTQPPLQARAFLAETAHILRAIFSALLKRRSGYASVLAAALELAGERVEAVAVAPEPRLDDSWSEPEVFGGCSTAGQARPAPVQAIRIHKKPVSFGAPA
ncbi:MAG: nitrate reductase molybdenum cofactor assembly chaperone [Rhodoferax sp.]|nr:nitrate reductase molybdenum cofactor assembly chaperone [Rhodoferax sp.]